VQQKSRQLFVRKGTGSD